MIIIIVIYGLLCCFTDEVSIALEYIYIYPYTYMEYDIYILYILYVEFKWITFTRNIGLKLFIGMQWGYNFINLNILIRHWNIFLISCLYFSQSSLRIFIFIFIYFVADSMGRAQCTWDAKQYWQVISFLCSDLFFFHRK